jgi:large subunit ribosomal protein L37Ae
MATKKVKSTGRYGVRYGLTIRQRVLDVEKNQKKKQKCPYCGRLRAKRISFGIFKCNKCEAKFTGRAYEV